MNKKLLFILIILTLTISSCSLISDRPAVVRGSGNVISETRDVTGFTSISLEGSANVHVTMGTTESVVVSGEDNIVPLIETNVLKHELVIKTKPLMSYSTTRPVRVDVTMISLDQVSISGSGNLDVPELKADSFYANLAGSGNITLSGEANTTNFTISGSGNIFSDRLTAKTAKALISGSGNITMYASDALDATITGSGDIRYSGSPASLSKNVSGSGSIHE